MSGFSSTKRVLKYAAMPEIMPRVNSLVFGGFGYIPFFIAAVYQMVGLLPKNHPYLMHKNIGRFGIRHVIAEAANNITFSLKNIDQIVLFIAVLAGMIIFAIQIFAMASVFMLQPVMALPASWSAFFVVPVGPREQDIAFMMLDMVFGVPHPSLANTGFFESCVGTLTACKDTVGAAAGGSNLVAMPTANFVTIDATYTSQMSPLSPNAVAGDFPRAFHRGLHTLFSIYSTALLVIAVMITSYFIATIIAETAQSGTPFGRRFNKTWAPLRIVVAFGLLVPLPLGINSSQYIVLYAAKYGSAFATNGWRFFNDTLSTSYLGAGQRLISTPNIPELDELTKFLFTARACKYAYEHFKSVAIAVDDEPPTLPRPIVLTPAQQIHAYALYEDVGAVNTDIVAIGTTYLTIQTNKGPTQKVLKIRFGVRDVQNRGLQNDVLPVCGEITLPFTDGNVAPATPEAYVNDIQQAWFLLVRDLWHNTSWLTIQGGPTYLPFDDAGLNGNNHRYRYIVDNHVATLPDEATPNNHQIGLDALYVQRINDNAQATMYGVVTAAVATAVGSGLWGGPYNGTGANADNLYTRGWASAGIWYNRIAQVNGHLTAVVYNTPLVTLYPLIMEKVVKTKIQYDNTLTVRGKFEPVTAQVGGMALLLPGTYGLEFATALDKAYTAWEGTSGELSKKASSSNPIIAILKNFFGLTGLYNMRNNTGVGNTTHPLAQLSGLGKSLVEGSMRSLNHAALATLFGTLSIAPDMQSLFANFLITFAMLGLTVGFVLFYVVPFLPFIYFFFAVGGWIKGIFEAMVGAPLWALAHIRIDGNGLSGNAALNGYFLIFEVALRPILIVFGMLASISIYSALVSSLNDIFSLVTENVAGYDVESEMAVSRNTLNYMRSEIDEFFYTVIYTIVVYMLGMSSFKLVDTMPNNILRWMGQSVATFGDQREDPAANMVSRASIGSQQSLGQVGRGLQATSKASIDAGS